MNRPLSLRVATALWLRYPMCLDAFCRRMGWERVSHWLVWRLDAYWPFSWAARIVLVGLMRDVLAVSAITADFNRWTTTKRRFRVI